MKNLIYTFILILLILTASFAQAQSTPAKTNPAVTGSVNTAPGCKDGFDYLCDNVVIGFAGPAYSFSPHQSNLLIAGTSYWAAGTWKRNGNVMCDFGAPMATLSATTTGGTNLSGGGGVIAASCHPAGNAASIQSAFAKINGIHGLVWSINLGVGF